MRGASYPTIFLRARLVVEIRRHLVVSSVWEQRVAPYPLGGPIWSLNLALTFR